MAFYALCSLVDGEDTKGNFSFIVQLRISHPILPSKLLFPLRDCIIYCFRFIHSNSCRSMKIMTLIMFNKGLSPSCSHIFVSYLSDVGGNI